MKTNYFLLLGCIVLLPFFVISQTIVPGGEVEGTWIKTASPYLIEGEVNIPLNKTLLIEPGVDVNFKGHYKFIIYGCIMAEGVYGDSILFTTDDKETGWHGLRFLDTETNSQPISKLTYCIIENGKSYGTCPDNCGAGVFISHSAPVISKSAIRNNNAVNGAGDWGGGGIYCEYANPEIHDNLITGNYSGHDGGGIYCTFNSPLISNNQIINNEAAYRGGGIATFSFASPSIMSNEIAGNQASSIGGGIYQSGGNSIIQGNIIRNNYAADGGGIACYLSNSKLYNNLIMKNEAFRGAGLWNQGSSPNTFNNTVIENTAYNSGGGMYNLTGMAGIPIYSNPLTPNNIFYFNLAEEGLQVYSVTGNVPILWYNDAEGLTSGGVFGDFTDQEGNMDIIPEFDSEGEHDCALSDDSECIDNGINGVGDFDLPETDILGNTRIWDGNNDGIANADMGAYEYGSSPVGVFNQDAFFNSFTVNVYPNPFIESINLSFQLAYNQQLTLSLYNLSGEKVGMLLDEKLNQGVNNQTFTLDWIPNGIYLLTIESNHEILNSTRIIKLMD